MHGYITDLIQEGNAGLTHAVDRIDREMLLLSEDQIQFSDVQGVGDPITIEELNREELYRLVLVNFARLSTKSEWNGLLG